MRASISASLAAIARVVRKACFDAVPDRFRLSIRGWAAECTDAPGEVCELGQDRVNDRIGAAYRRNDLFDHRAPMQQRAAFFATSAWARGSGCSVLPLPASCYVPRVDPAGAIPGNVTTLRTGPHGPFPQPGRPLSPPCTQGLARSGSTRSGSQ